MRNLKAAALARSGKIGEARIFDSVFTMQVRGGNLVRALSPFPE